MAKVIKEIIIMLIVCLITMLILAVGLYQYIPSRKSVPEITTYVASEEVQDLLEDDIDEDDEEKIVDTYEVTSSDLSSYQATNDYIPGKSNPFAAASSTVTGESEETTTTDDTSDSTSSSSSSTEQSSTPSVYSGNSSTK